MKLEVFKEVIARLKRNHEKQDACYRVGIDLYELNDDLFTVVSMLIGTIYGKECLDTFDWWCYDNEWGTKGLEFTDHDGTPLCQTIEDLHHYLESSKKDDYSLRSPLSEEEQAAMLQKMAEGFAS